MPGLNLQDSVDSAIGSVSQLTHLKNISKKQEETSKQIENQTNFQKNLEIGRQATTEEQLNIDKAQLKIDKNVLAQQMTQNALKKNFEKNPFYDENEMKDIYDPNKISKGTYEDLMTQKRGISAAVESFEKLAKDNPEEYNERLDDARHKENRFNTFYPDFEKKYQQAQKLLSLQDAMPRLQTALLSARLKSQQNAVSRINKLLDNGGKE